MRTLSALPAGRYSKRAATCYWFALKCASTHPHLCAQHCVPPKAFDPPSKLPLNGSYPTLVVDKSSACRPAEPQLILAPLVEGSVPIEEAIG
jgi:hypothetical protein